MIKLKYKNIQDNLFNQAIAKLAGHTFRDFRFNYNVAKFVRKFQIHVNDAQEEFLSLVKQYAILDEHGDFVPENNIPGTYTIKPEKVEEWKLARADFDSTEFEIPCHKMRIDQLEGAPLSAMDILAIEDLLDETEEGVVAKVAETEEAAASLEVAEAVSH
jgi:hypothetical protein